MLSLEKPEIFTPKFEIVSCFVEHKDEILLLLRQDHKPQPNTYWVPAGKVDEWVDKDTHEAMTREWKEETQLDLSDAEYLMKTYVQYPWYDFIYHMYRKNFQEKPNVIINPEEHKWFTRDKLSDALKKDLIQDLDECIRLVYNVEKEDTKVLELQWLSYQDKRDKLDEYEDFLIEKFNHIKHWNAIINLLREILKNSADHTDWDVYVTVTTEKIWEKIKVAFSIYDDGPGIQANTTREKKWQYNFGIGLWMIEELAKIYNIDLIMHNQGEINHLNNIWLQTNIQPKEKFGYEWIWMFDIQQ